MRLGFKERKASSERSRAFMIGLGLFGVAVFVTFAWIGFTAPNGIPGRSYYYLYAQIKNADNITQHNQVRVDGDIVGQVLDPEVVNGIGVLKLQLDPSVAPLRSDSTLQVLPRSAVGVRYIEITPGLHGHPLQSGGVLSFTQASATTPLDTALDTFDPVTRHNTQLFFRAFGEGLAGQGQNINDALGSAPAMLSASGAPASSSLPASIGGAPAMLQSSEGVLTAIADHPGYTASLVRGSGTLAGASAPVREAIAEGFHPEALALRPFDDTSGVDGTLSAAPPALAAATTELPAFDRLAVQLTGVANGIEPGLQAAPGAFSQTSALFVDARTALIRTRAVLGTVGRAVNPVLTLLHMVQPILAPLRGGLLSAMPILADLSAHGCDFVSFGRNWTSGMEYGNSEGNVLRFELSDAVLYGAKTPDSNVPDNPNPAPCVAGHGG